MSLNGFRGMLYSLAKILGDVQAVSSGKPDKVAKRFGRRIVGKMTEKLLGKLFK